MDKVWLIIDSNYIAHRAFYSTGSLDNGVAYGFLSAILSLQDDFATKDILFCFDYGKGIREKKHPEYKKARREKEKNYTDEEREAKRELRREVRKIRDEILPEIGFRNVFKQKGREADDLVAKLCETLPADEKVIVSGDHDLYQCLDARTVMYKPIKKEVYTHKHLFDEFGVTAVQWAEVKALAGCTSDGIKGIKGIGEKTAAKYLIGGISESSKAYQKITEGYDTFTKNLPLVRLPYPGTKIPIIKEDKVTTQKWKTVLKRLGIQSLLKRV